MIPHHDIGIREQVFTHIDDETNAQTTYAVERMAAWCAEHHVQMVKVPVEEQHARYCLKERGVEPHRLARLRPEDLVKPILFVMLPDDSALLADGTHRYVRLWQLHQPFAPAYIMRWEDAEQFKVELPQLDPEKLRTMWSGI